MTKKKEGSTYRYWTPEEDAVIRDTYPKPMGGRLCVYALKTRTIHAVHGRAVFLGLKGSKNTKGSRMGFVYTKIGQAKGPLNRAAKVWQFENKSLGVVISGTNINHLVIEHRALFDKSDVDTVYACGSPRAATCLRGLSSNAKDKTKIGNSWKGWVFLRKSPGTVNDSLDFIGIRFLDQNTQGVAV